MGTSVTTTIHCFHDENIPVSQPPQQLADILHVSTSLKTKIREKLKITLDEKTDLPKFAS